MSASPSTTSMSLASNSSAKSCPVCGLPYPDLHCACGDTFHFACIDQHAELINFEFQFVQNKVAERLLQVEQVVEDINCADATTIVENWKRKRLQDINDIANVALTQIARRETAYVEVAPLRNQFNQICQETDDIIHDRLNSIVALQQQVHEKSDQLNTLPGLLQDDLNLDATLQSKLNPNIPPPSLPVYQSESTSSLTTTTEDSGVYIRAESFTSPPTTAESNTDSSINPEPTVSLPVSSTDSISNAETTGFNLAPVSNTDSITNTEPEVLITMIPSNENSTTNVESSVPLTNSTGTNNFTAAPLEQDEFETGETENIQRQNPIVIAINNDKHVATIACHGNQLLYNDYHQRTGQARLTFIPNFTRATEKQIIDWAQPDAIVSGGDNDWIQDMTYCAHLGGYLLLNRSRLRLLRDDTQELEDFYQFPDRSMKRVTCNDSFIYLIVASGATGQNGDEIVLMDYEKQERITKSFRDIVVRRNNRLTGALVGEISDLAVNNNGRVIAAYRLERYREVGVCIYNVSSNGHQWTSVTQLLLNECWHNDLSYTPRIEWCEKFNAFIILEYMTGHLIILDQTGQVRGESRFSCEGNRRDPPLNLSVSSNDWLCIRYESFINIYRLGDNRL